MFNVQVQFAQASVRVYSKVWRIISYLRTVENESRAASPVSYLNQTETLLSPQIVKSHTIQRCTLTLWE